MAWHRPGDRPLSEPMIVRLPTYICITRPQWVNLPARARFVGSNLRLIPLHPHTTPHPHPPVIPELKREYSEISLLYGQFSPKYSQYTPYSELYGAFFNLWSDPLQEARCMQCRSLSDCILARPDPTKMYVCRALGIYYEVHIVFK